MLSIHLSMTKRFFLGLWVVLLSSCLALQPLGHNLRVKSTLPFSLVDTRRAKVRPSLSMMVAKEKTEDEHSTTTSSRRNFLFTAAALSLSIAGSSWWWWLYPDPACAKCKDLESCREIGEQKEAADLAANPIIRLGGGLQYKVLTTGLGDAEVSTDTDVVKIAYSISQASGRYMYSRGFGYNQLDAGNGKQMADLGMDGLTIHLHDETAKEVPIGIRQAIMGMKRGEKRRIEVPPSLGFETSDWNPKPTTFRGERQIIKYKNVLFGQGDQQPPFPAPTIWDVELLSLR